MLTLLAAGGLMRRTIAMMLCVVAVSATTFAGPPESEERAAAHARRGKVKLTVGVALAAAGAWTLPVTGVRPNGLGNDSSGGGPQIWAGLGLIAAGSGLVWSGVSDRRRAQPQLTLRVVAGRTTAVGLRRTW
jgi:hypothetical protein